MFISRLRIKNFKNIEDVELHFDKLNIFIGEPGSGKSSILQPITYLLTDYLAETKGEYVRWGKDKFELEMDFTHHGKEGAYIVRAGEKGTDRSLVIEEEEFIGSDAVKKMKTLVNPTLTLFSAISQQGESTSILFESPADRLAKLKSILGMDRVVEIVEQMRSDAKEKRDQANLLKTEVKSMAERRFSRIDTPKLPDIKAIEEEFEGLVAIKTEFAQKEVDYKNALNIYNNKVADYNSLLRVLNNQNETVKKLHVKVATLQEQIAQVEVSRRIPAPNISQEEVEKFTSEGISCGHEIKTLKERIDLIQKGKCPTCGKDYKGDIAAEQEKLNNLMERSKLIAETIHKAKFELEDYNKKRQDQEKKKVLFEERNTQLESVTKELEEQQAKLKSLIDESELAMKHMPEKPLQPIFEHSTRYNELEKELVVYQQKLAEHQRVVKYNADQDKAEQDNKLAIQAKEKEIDDLLEQVTLLDESRNLLDKEFSAYLIEQGTSYISSKMNEFFQKSYGKYHISFKQDKKSVDFFYSDGTKLASVMVASGFEKQSISVAFRVALCSMQDLGLLALDEIDSDAPASKSMELYKVLLNEGTFEQYFCISHKSETQELLVNEFYAKAFYLEAGRLRN